MYVEQAGFNVPTTPRPATQASPRTRGLSLGQKQGGGQFKSFSRDAQLVESSLLSGEVAHIQPLFIGDLSHLTPKPSTAPTGQTASPRPTTRGTAHAPRDESSPRAPARGAPLSLQLDELGSPMGSGPAHSPSPPARADLKLRPESLPPLPPVTPGVERTPRGPGDGRYDVAVHRQRGAWTSAEPGGNGVPKTGPELEAWLHETLVAAARAKTAGGGAADLDELLMANGGSTFDQGLGALGLARGQLRSAQMHSESIDRMYRALYVYSVGFADVLKQLSEHVPNRGRLIPQVWKAYMMLVEERQHLAFPSALATMVRDQEEERQRVQKQHEKELAAASARAEQLMEEVLAAKAETARVGRDAQQVQDIANAAKIEAERLRRELKRESKAMSDVQSRLARELAFRTTLRATVEPRFAKYQEVYDTYQDALAARKRVDMKSPEEGGGDAVGGFEAEPIGLQTLFVKEDQLRSALQHEVAKLEQSVRDEIKGRKETEKMLEEARGMIRTLGDQANDLKTQLQQAHESHARAKRAYEEIMLKRVAGLQEQVDLWRSRHEAEAKEVARLNDKLTEVLERVTASEQARADLEQALDRETAVRSAAEKRVEALERELAAEREGFAKARAEVARLQKRGEELRGALRTSVESHAALRLAIQGEIRDRVRTEGELAEALASLAVFREREAFMMEKISNQVLAIRSADDDRRKRAAETAAAEGKTVDVEYSGLGPAPRMGEDVVKDLEYLTVLAGRETMKVGEAIFHAHMEAERLKSEFRRVEAERAAEAERMRTEARAQNAKISNLERDILGKEGVIHLKNSKEEELTKKLASEQEARKLALKRVAEMQETIDSLIAANAREALANKEVLDETKRNLEMERTGKHSAEARNAKLMEELGRAARAKSEADALAARLKAELDSQRRVASLVPGLEQKLADERAGRQQSETTVRDQRRDLDEKEAAMREVEEEAALLEAENAKLEAAKALLEAEVARLVGDLGDIEHDIELAEQEAEECRAQAAADRDALLAVEKRYEQLRLWSLSGAEQREVALQKEIRSLRQKLAEAAEAAKRAEEQAQAQAKRPGSGAATGATRGRPVSRAGATTPPSTAAGAQEAPPSPSAGPAPSPLPGHEGLHAEGHSGRRGSVLNRRGSLVGDAIPLQVTRPSGPVRPQKGLEQQLAEMRQAAAVLEIKLEGEARARRLVEAECARLRGAHDQLLLRLHVQEKLAAAARAGAGAPGGAAEGEAPLLEAEAEAGVPLPEGGPFGASPPPVEPRPPTVPRLVVPPPHPRSALAIPSVVLVEEARAEAGPQAASPPHVPSALNLADTRVDQRLLAPGGPLAGLVVPSPLATPLPPPGPHSASSSVSPERTPREVRSAIMERRAAREARKAAAEAAAAAKAAAAALTPLEEALRRPAEEVHAGYRNEERELISAAAEALKRELPGARRGSGSQGDSGAATPAPVPRNFLGVSQADGATELQLAAPPPVPIPPARSAQRTAARRARRLGAAESPEAAAAEAAGEMTLGPAAAEGSGPEPGPAPQGT